MLQKRYGSASQCESAKNGLVLSEHRPVLELAVPAENAEARWVIPPNQGYIVNIHISFLHSLSFAGRASNTCKTFFLLRTTFSKQTSHPFSPSISKLCPPLSLLLVSRMLFNLKPEHEPPLKKGPGPRPQAQAPTLLYILTRRHSESKQEEMALTILATASFLRGF